jgi:Aldo/keto reductase family
VLCHGCDLTGAALNGAAPWYTGCLFRRSAGHEQRPHNVKVNTQHHHNAVDALQQQQTFSAPPAGTWAWGNKFLFGYDTSMDPELQQLFEYAVGQGVNLFDTADSYGTGVLNGRSEQLLGSFIRDLPYKDAATRVHVATKLAGYPWRVTPWNMTAACQCASCFWIIFIVLSPNGLRVRVRVLLSLHGAPARH